MCLCVRLLTRVCPAVQFFDNDLNHPTNTLTITHARRGTVVYSQGLLKGGLHLLQQARIEAACRRLKRLAMRGRDAAEPLL